MNIALIQMKIKDTKKENLATAKELISNATRFGADIVVLPEMFCCPYTPEAFKENAETAGDNICRVLSRFAWENAIYVVGGSIPEVEDGKYYNTTFVFDSSGRLAAKYRKIHLFDADIPGQDPVRESDVFTPGEETAMINTPWGKLGFMICYDLRFPEQALKLAQEGADAIIIPAQFGVTTGEAHWELLMRTRAVDNQVFTIGVSPARRDDAPYVCYGHSMVCSPWGEVLCEGGEGHQILTCEIDTAETASIRQQLPLLKAREK